LLGTLVAGRFRVEKKIAAGGMGVVYLAEQVPLGRQVALKILDTQQLDEERAKNFGERFFLEAAAVAKLQHPNTITIHDFGKTDDDIYYYAMEFVDGASLSQFVHHEGALSPAAAIHVGVQVCGSLREAHRVGMIHRDVKPGNIMLTERHDDPYFAKVLDFGLVKVMGDEELEASDLTQSGVLLGSPRYMAPEQVLCLELDARCDIYSLGGVLYHAITGLPPFVHGSQFELLRAQVAEIPKPFSAVAPGCQASARLEALIFRMLEKERDARPQDMTEIAAELVACAREIGVEEVSLSGSIPRLSRPGRRRIDGVSEEVSAVQVEEPTEATSQLRRTDASIRALAEVPVEAVPETPSAPEPVAVAPPVTPPAEPSGSSRALWLMIAVIALLAAGGGVFAVAFFAMPEPPPTELAHAVSVGAAEPTPDLPSAVEPSETDPSETDPSETDPSETDPSADPAAATIRIETDPPGARIRHGAEDLGDAPFSFELPAGERWELEVSLEGHETRTVLASPGRDVLRVRLSEEAAAPEPHTGQTRRRRAQPVTTPAEPSEPTTPVQPEFRDRGDLRHPWGHPQ